MYTTYTLSLYRHACMYMKSTNLMYTDSCRKFLDIFVLCNHAHTHQVTLILEYNAWVLEVQQNIQITPTRKIQKIPPLIHRAKTNQIGFDWQISKPSTHRESNFTEWNAIRPFNLRVQTNWTGDSSWYSLLGVLHTYSVSGYLHTSAGQLPAL